jgi:hypothetical protein
MPPQMTPITNSVINQSIGSLGMQLVPMSMGFDLTLTRSSLAR